MNFFSWNSPLWKAINKLVMMMYAGMLWFLCSLPIVTCGAATAALYEVMLKMAKDQEGYLTVSFFRAFRGNLKNGILTWLPLLAAGFVFAVNIFYYGVLGGGSFKVQTGVFTVLFLCVQALQSYTFPVMAKFENTPGNTLRIAAVLAFRNPGWTALLLVIQLLTLFVCWFFVYLPVLFIMGIAGYVGAVIFNRMFDRLI